MIYVTGDLHGASEIRRFSFDYLCPKAAIEKNVILQLGDAGLIWSPVGGKHLNEENYWLNWFEKFRSSLILLCVLGNHENYFRIYNGLEQTEMFGAVCYKVRNNIFYIKHGEILTIESKTFFAFGGASSIDKSTRIENVSWWADEEANFADQRRALENLEKYNNTVDYIISHTAPLSVIREYFSFVEKEDGTSRFLEEIKNKVTFKKWYFGHFHENRQLNETFHCLYQALAPIL